MKKASYSKKPARKMASSNYDSTANKINCMKTLTEVISKCDKFSVYGEHIAIKLQNSGRSC
jgi:hypothetical protein